MSSVALNQAGFGAVFFFVAKSFVDRIGTARAGFAEGLGTFGVGTLGETLNGLELERENGEAINIFYGKYYMIVTNAYSYNSQFF